MSITKSHNRKTSNYIKGLAVLLALSASAVRGQAPAGVSGPIDIQASEQEFGQDQVIARGNVRVTYKESVIVAPVATLFKDPTGNPNRAVFTGHPRLTQGTNKIDADVLTFELANQKILAKGNAHSEVEGGEDEPAKKPAAQTKATAPANQNIDGSDEANDDNTAGNTTSAAALKTSADPLASASQSGKGDKIITDSDLQEYDQSTGAFIAIGNVRVKHGDIFVKADKLSLVYGASKKPETAVFTGHVVATQNKNSTQADNITYSLSTKRLQATGNVKSTVIQDKNEKKKVKAEGDLLLQPAKASAPSKDIFADSKGDGNIIITSDTQDYSRTNGRLSAHGNVRIYYNEMSGAGPSVVVVRNNEGKAEKVYFIGRSQISQPGRRWIADSITYVVADKKVIAQGNSKAMIIQQPGTGNGGAPLQIAPLSPANTRLADKPASGANKLSASRIEVPK